MFILEGYDESYEFRILVRNTKFRHFIIQNNFTFMKILVKEGWTNQDTGKKTNLNSICLGAVFTRRLGDLCKEINCVAQYKDLEAEFIHKLGHLFYDNKGDNQVSFEIMELER
jgi:DNA polymerase-3 subunit alpha